MNSNHSNKKVLILVFNGLKTDARVQKQITVLNANYDITAVSFQDPEINDLKHKTVKEPKPGFLIKYLTAFLLLLRAYTTAYWLLYDYKYLKREFEESFDLIIANDIETIPLAFYLKGKAKIIFDAHEYAPRQFDNNWQWRLLFKDFNLFLCKKYIPQVDRMITQNPLFATEYERNFGVLPEVMTNAPDYHEIEPHLTPKDEIKIIHHGIYNKTRKLERLFDIINLLDERYRLFLMVHLPIASNESTKEKYLHFKEMSLANRKVEWLEPVDGNEVVDAIAKFDLGIHILEPINFNHEYSLPNKLLEFIQARLAVVIGPSPGMTDFVNKYEIGKIAIDFTIEALLGAIQSMSISDIDSYKRNSVKASKELNSDVNRRVLSRIVKESFAG